VTEIDVFDRTDTLLAFQEWRWSIYSASLQKMIWQEKNVWWLKYNTATFMVQGTSRQASASIITTFEHAKPFVLFLLSQRAVTTAARHTWR